MANIRLKELVEANVDPKLVARSKETGKLVYFKNAQNKDAAMKAGTHLDPKDKKGDEPKGDAKPNDMFGGDYAKDRGGEAPKANLPKKASQLTWEHGDTIADTLNKEAGLDGYAQTDDNSGAIMYNASKGEMPTYTLYMGSNVDYNKPDEFRVSLEPTYGNDPSKLQGKVDKSFKSSKDAMTYMKALAKKYNKEMQMDDSKTSSKLSTMTPKSKPTPKIVGNWKDTDEDGRMSSDAADDVRNYLNDVLGVDGVAEVDFGSGNIQYGLADSENSIFVGNDDGTYNVSFEGPSMDIDKINQSYKSFKNPKDALTYAGELAKANRKGLEQKYTDTADTDGQTDDELYDALYDMGYDFGELGSDDFDEDGFADAAMSLGYRYDDKNKVWYNRDEMEESSTKLTSMIKKIKK